MMAGNFSDGRTREGRAVNDIGGIGCGSVILGIVLLIALNLFVFSDFYEDLRSSTKLYLYRFDTLGELFADLALKLLGGAVALLGGAVALWVMLRFFLRKIRGLFSRKEH
tara:strand:- start:231 stop:560 length:330 start_codon:yes stop_codon:yes gene_type:complete